MKRLLYFLCKFIIACTPFVMYNCTNIEKVKIEYFFIGLSFSAIILPILNYLFYKWKSFNSMMYVLRMKLTSLLTKHFLIFSFILSIVYVGIVLDVHFLNILSIVLHVEFIYSLLTESRLCNPLEIDISSSSSALWDRLTDIV